MVFMSEDNIFRGDCNVYRIASANLKPHIVRRRPPPFGTGVACPVGGMAVEPLPCHCPAGRGQVGYPVRRGPQASQGPSTGWASMVAGSICSREMAFSDRPPLQV